MNVSLQFEQKSHPNLTKTNDVVVEPRASKLKTFLKSASIEIERGSEAAERAAFEGMREIHETYRRVVRDHPTVREVIRKSIEEEQKLAEQFQHGLKKLNQRVLHSVSGLEEHTSDESATKADPSPTPTKPKNDD